MPPNQEGISGILCFPENLQWLIHILNGMGKSPICNNYDKSQKTLLSERLII